MWLWNKLKQIWEWLFPTAKAMAVNSRIVCQMRSNSVNSEEGDIIEVMPADWVPSLTNKYYFLIIDSERTVDENKELLKSGVPDDVQSAWSAEDERVRTEILAEISSGKSKGLTDDEIKTKISKNTKCVFDPAKKIDHDSYPHRRFKVDTTAIPSTTLSRINAGLDCRDNNKAECEAKELQRAQEKWAEHKGRELTTGEKAKTIQEIIKEYEALDAQVAVAQAAVAPSAPLGAIIAKVAAESMVAEADRKIDEIRKAAADGGREVLHPLLMNLDQPEPVLLNIDELAPIIIQK